MTKVWSFNTTIRNPERMENMLRALNVLEGRDFDGEGQKEFFGLQIKKRLYKPEKRTLVEQDLIDSVHADDTAEEIDDQVVKRILAKYTGDVDAAGRGRTSAGILNRFGLCVALQSNGPVIITDLAKRWLEHEISDEELFTKFLIKWQYPNGIESGYKNFNIKPFVGTLKLISLVNKKWSNLSKKPVGLSKLEYQLFVPSLIKSDQIEKYANQIIEFRSKKESKIGKEKEKFVKKFSSDRVKKIFGSDKKVETALSDLRDYTDSSIRYFRISGLIALRGGDTHIDIARGKEVEVEAILEKISAEAKKFSSDKDYFDHLNNLDAIPLPWEDEVKLSQISENLSNVLKEEAGEDVATQYISETESLPAKTKVQQLESRLNDVRIQKLRDLKHDLNVLDDCIQKLESITTKGYETLTSRPSLDLEWFTSRALMVLNDAVNIEPSYTIGDDGIPTGFRPNVSDIKCHYNSFGMTVEMTLLLGRDQWYAEGQPVMRHLRDFEDESSIGDKFCLFIAPYIHRDTLNTFWISNTVGYEGKKQVIIPFRLSHFLDVLKGARNKISSGKMSHDDLLKLFRNITDKITDTNDPNNWTANFPQLIEEWAKS